MNTRSGPRARQSRWRTVLVGLTAAVVSLGLSLGGAGVAQAAYDDPAPRGAQSPGWWADMSPTRVWWGAVDQPGNAEAPSWCIQATIPAPGGSAAVEKVIIDKPVVDVQGLVKEQYRLTVPQIAYLLQKYQGELQPEIRASLAMLVHFNLEMDNSASFSAADSVTNMAGALESHPMNHLLVPVMERFADEARAGVPASYGSIEYSGTEEKRAGTFTVVFPKNAANETVGGLAYDLNLVGDATFADGSQSLSGTTSADTSTKEFAWTGKKNGKFVATITYKNVPRQTLTLLSSQNAGVQTTVTPDLRPASDPIQMSVTGPDIPVVRDFQPIAESNVGASKVVDGNTITDTIKVTADNSYGYGKWLKDGGKNVPVTFAGTAYYTGDHPAAEQPTVPAGAKVVGSTTIVADGPGLYEATIKTSIDASFITWVWKAVKNDQGKYSDWIAADWNDKFGIGAETTSKRHEFDIDSSIVIRPTKSGEYLIDDIFVNGLPEDHPNWNGSHGFKADVTKLTQQLLFFPKGLAVTDANASKAEVIGQTTIPAANGFYPSVGSTVFKVKEGNPEGTYVFVTSFAGDDRVKPFTSSVTDQNEQYVVTEEKPELKTTATDGADNDHSVTPTKQVTINDQVCYTGLKPGTEYTVKGTLMDKETGQPVVVNGNRVEASKTFTPKDASGCETVTFTFDGAELGGKATVVFERAYVDGKLVAAHTDLNDEGQTVTFEEKPTLGTTATDGKDGDKTVTPERTVTINDKVCYTGLKPGVEYKLDGVLMDKDTGKPVDINGSSVESSTTFTPEKADGCVTVTFEFDGSSLAGKSVVVFEKAFVGEVLVADHEDINDEGQTVTFDPTPAGGITGSGGLANTGAQIGLVALLGALAAGGSGIALVTRRTKK